MTTKELSELILKHDDAIRKLEISSGQMMMIWKAVGAVALASLVAYLTTIFK